MKATEAHAALSQLGRSSFTTNDAAAALEVTRANAAQILTRLGATGQVLRLARGRWALPGIEPWELPEALSSPKPSYISLHTALWHYGVIEQIAAVTYAVTLAATRRVKTPRGAVSLHQVAPRFFCGFEVQDNGVKLASVEKALIDFLYLKPARSRLFAALPEIEIPRSFSFARARRFANLVDAASRREMIRGELGKLEARHRR